MTTPDDRPPPRRSRQVNQAAADRRPRQRREPLFQLTDDDIAPMARRAPPAPLGDLVEDIDRALPSRAAPQPLAARPERAPRLPSAPAASAAAEAYARREAAPAHEPAPQRAATAQRPVATRERPPAPRAELRPAPADELVEVQAAPLRRARGRLDDASSDLARLEHDLAARGRLGYGGYLAPAPSIPSLGSWPWLAVVALASALILFTMGGAGAAGFSRWGGLLPGGSPDVQNQLNRFVGQARPVGDYALRAPPSLTPAMIDSILASYGSPAAGTGEVWYNLGLKYGIDPAFAVAFFVHESGAGTAQAWAGLKPDGSSTHNVGNIICAGYASCYGRFRDYPSWAEGIEDWYRLIDVEYLQGRGHQTVADIIPVYAPSFENDVQGYVNVVHGLVDGWRAQGAP